MLKYFRNVGSYDPAPVREAVLEHQEAFKEQTWRQDFPGSPHRDSETIFLRMPGIITPDTVFDSLDIKDLPAMLEPRFADACRAIGAVTGKPLARAMLVALRAGGSIVPHVDEGAYAEATERYHLPIVTDPAVLFYCGDECVHMQAGDIWWFNKHEMHFVQGGAGDRLHLIVDVFK